MTYGALLLFFALLTIQSFFYIRNNSVNTLKDALVKNLEFMKKYGFWQALMFLIAIFSTNSQMIFMSIAAIAFLALTNICALKSLAVKPYKKTKPYGI